MTAPAVRLPVRLKSGGTPPPERPQAGLTDGGLLDLESRWHSLQGLIKGIGEDMRGMSLEQARPLEERSAKVDGEILEIEARIAASSAEGLIGLAVKLRLLAHYHTGEGVCDGPRLACVQTALRTAEEMLIAGQSMAIRAAVEF